MGNAERFVGGQIRRLTAQGCLGDCNSWIQEHGEVSHGAQRVRRWERAASALRRVAARRPSNNVPHWTSSEPSQIGRQLSAAAAGEALILNFLKDTSAAS
jgi:hypothetical protein